MVEKAYTVQPGDRIAQLVFMPIVRTQFKMVEEFACGKRARWFWSFREKLNVRTLASIFRAYDIRGIVGKQLTEETVYLLVKHSVH